MHLITATGPFHKTLKFYEATEYDAKPRKMTEITIKISIDNLASIINDIIEKNNRIFFIGNNVLIEIKYIISIEQLTDGLLLTVRHTLCVGNTPTSLIRNEIVRKYCGTQDPNTLCIYSTKENSLIESKVFIFMNKMFFILSDCSEYINIVDNEVAGWNMHLMFSTVDENINLKNIFNRNRMNNFIFYKYSMTSKEIYQCEGNIHITENSKLVIEKYFMRNSYKLDDIQYNLLNKLIKEGNITEFQKNSNKY